MVAPKWNEFFLLVGTIVTEIKDICSLDDVPT